MTKTKQDLRDSRESFLLRSIQTRMEQLENEMKSFAVGPTTASWADIQDLESIKENLEQAHDTFLGIKLRYAEECQYFKNLD